jgi:putative NIF3 family GTP cyclohydrolase 1 type 2
MLCKDLLKLQAFCQRSLTLPVIMNTTSKFSADNAQPVWHRRKFIAAGLQLAGFSAVAAMPPFAWKNPLPDQDPYTVGKIIDLIVNATGNNAKEHTVDTIKFGSRDNLVTGIVTTMFPTINVIQQTIAQKANLLLVHEPTFYSGKIDEKSWIERSEVIERKTRLLRDNNITIWRVHDSWHTLKPDGITYGVIQKLGWEKYYEGETTFTISVSRFGELVKYLKQRMAIDHLRVIGDLDDRISKVSLLPGAWGGEKQMSTIIKDKPDVLIVGEVAEWETAEYVRDARALGDKISLIVLGHAMSEEPGMQWLADWLKPRVPGLSVTHIVSGSPFKWL